MIQLLLWPVRVQAERPSAKMCEVDATSSPLEVVPAHFAERNVSGPAVNVSTGGLCMHLHQAMRTFGWTEA